MKKVRIILLSAVLIAGMSLLSGCNFNKNIETNTIVVQKDGSILGVIVDVFDKDYYNSEELQQKIQNDVAEYNSTAGTDSIVIDKYEVTEQKQVYLYLKYKTFKDYIDFNEKELFVGTVSDAYEAGKAFMEMSSVSNQSDVLSAEDVLERGSSKIVIFEEPICVKVNGKISYVSGGVKEISKKEASADGEGPFCILYE